MAINDIIAITQNVGGSFDEIATNTVIDGLKVLKQNASGGFDEAVTPLNGDIIALKQNAAGNYDESIISLFDGILYNNGVEGVEWVSGIMTGDAAKRILDKSQNVLHAQVSGTGTGIETSWITNNPVDVSKYNNLRVVFDSSASSSSIVRVGIFLGTTKNQSSSGSSSTLPSLFTAYFIKNGTATNYAVDIPFRFSGELYVSVMATKLTTSNGTGIIKAKEIALETVFEYLFPSSGIVFEQGYKTATAGGININTDFLEVAAYGYSGEQNTIVTANPIDVTLFKTLRITFTSTGQYAYCYLGVLDNKMDSVVDNGGVWSNIANSQQTLSFDLTGVSGAKYIAFCAQSWYYITTDVVVTQIELLP